MRYGNSTVGMTVYNLLASQGPLPIEGLQKGAQAQLPGMDDQQTQAASDELVKRGRIKVVDGVYALVAQECLAVCARDESDYDPKTGEGGWEGWRVKDPRIRDGIGTRPLEYLIGQMPKEMKP